MVAVVVLMKKDIAFVGPSYRNLDRCTHFVAENLIVLGQSIAFFIEIFFIVYKYIFI